MSSFKVKAKGPDGSAKLIELDRNVSYDEFKSRLENSFELKSSVIKTLQGKPLYQDMHLKDALKELAESGGRYLEVTLSGSGGGGGGGGGYTPPAPAAAPASSAPASYSSPSAPSPSSYSAPAPAAASSAYTPSRPAAAPAPAAVSPPPSRASGGSGGSGGAGSCTNCGQAITGQGLRALGGVYHKECFTCHVCEKSLTDGMFQQHEGRLYCANDFLHVAADKCTACNNPITSAFLNINGAKYHPECFVCGVCRKPFQGSYTTKNGEPVHASCAY
eukprot:TRINITY_DN680_c0_g1_i2.p1 TRINITY_DN680_c0_g1~~TRINITY_DN680_c0_g1_i2.p1  ORF type:complete len:295 (-),score=73.46 TRINITY_DN680_c0_g1_i2:64-888(-)